MDRKFYPLIAFNLVYIFIFAIWSYQLENYEFIIYDGIVIAILALLVWKNKSIPLKMDVLWGLSIWGLLHMAGGNVVVGDDVLYGLQLIPKILRYDQAVHFFGFGITTVLSLQLLKPHLSPKISKMLLAMLLVMMGMGFGALNEVVEFMAVLMLPETGVGGYYNTAWDLTFNLFGAIAALFYLKAKKEL